MGERLQDMKEIEKGKKGGNWKNFLRAEG